MEDGEEGRKLVSNKSLSFPADHYGHDTPIEWLYFWGRFSNGKFFHFATFRVTKPLSTTATHWSIHSGQASYWEELGDDFSKLKYGVAFIAKGDRFSICSMHFGLHMRVESKPVIHKVAEYRNYYSIPLMKAEGIIYPEERIEADVWMDHEFSDSVFLGGFIKGFTNWDWVGIRLGCGISIMCFNRKEDRCCSVTLKDETINSNFILEDKHLFIHSLGMYLILEPLEREVIFDPKFGVSYSEVPFNVISKGEIIGYGMRERTHYKEEKNAI
jgi:hypothetical protein